MNLWVILSAVLAIVAMVSATNPMCNDAAQSGGGYTVVPMSTGRAAAGTIKQRPRYNH